MFSKLTTSSKHYTPTLVLVPPADEMAKILIRFSFFMQTWGDKNSFLKFCFGLFCFLTGVFFFCWQGDVLIEKVRVYVT